MAGYMILVLGTNINLYSLSAVTSIIESVRWSVVTPVPCHDRTGCLSSNLSRLGEAGQEAVTYIAVGFSRPKSSLQTHTLCHSCGTSQHHPLVLTCLGSAFQYAAVRTHAALRDIPTFSSVLRSSRTFQRLVLIQRCHVNSAARSSTPSCPKTPEYANPWFQHPPFSVGQHDMCSQGKQHYFL
jgi:hypothetical protein